MNDLHVKSGDNVLIISGKDRGKKGKVMEVSPKEGKVIVQGRNIRTKHVKARKATDAAGIVKAEGAIYACKVMPICPKCNKPARVGSHTYTDGKKMIHQRICKRCGEIF